MRFAGGFSPDGQKVCGRLKSINTAKQGHWRAYFGDTGSPSTRFVHTAPCQLLPSDGNCSDEEQTP